MGEQEAEFAAFLRLLDECDCLEHVIVVGSWAELVYGRAGLLEGFDPNIRTMDIDFLIRNLRRPVPSASLAAVARRAGYLVSSDRLNGITKIYEKKGLEIEFLIGKVGETHVERDDASCAHVHGRSRTTAGGIHVARMCTGARSARR